MSAAGMRLLSSADRTPDYLRAGLAKNPGALFAVFDAAGRDVVPPRMEELGERAASLFDGEAAKVCMTVAPSLAQVDLELLEWIEAELAGQPWGVFVIASLPLADVRHQLRKSLVIEDPERGKVFFRYYDPRVLPTFLETADAVQLDQLFGPLYAFVVPVGPGSLRSYRRAGREKG